MGWFVNILNLKRTGRPQAGAGRPQAGAGRPQGIAPTMDQLACAGVRIIVGYGPLISFPPETERL